MGVTMAVTMGQRRWIVAIFAVVLMIAAWAAVLLTQHSLIVRRFSQSGVPMIFMAPPSAQQSPVPGVLVTHGYAGSKQLMLGYGHVLAHWGYGVLLWDNAGHGNNAQGFGSFERSGDAGQGQLEPSPAFRVALEALKAQPEVDGDRLALLGHSLGGGTSLQAAIQDPETFAATIAISSVPAPVKGDRPRNLQLQYGVLEGRWIQDNAEQLLAAAGGAQANTEDGQGRSLVAIENVEHTTILFSDQSHQAALSWLNQVFGLGVTGATVPPDQQILYSDRRIFFGLLHGLAGLVFLGAIAPQFPLFPVTFKRPKSTWLGLFTAPIVAGAVLLQANQHLDLAALGGIQVGGAVALWFLIGGTVWLAFSARLPRPSLQNIAVGLGLFGGLWFAFGALAEIVWLPWLLIPARLKLWPLLALAVFPWMLAAGNVQKDARTGRRLLIWLVQSVVLVLGFGLAVYFVPSLFFMVLLLPFFPVVMGMLAWVGAFYDDPWTYGVASALFFGWLLAAVFPLV